MLPVIKQSRQTGFKIFNFEEKLFVIGKKLLTSTEMGYNNDWLTCRSNFNMLLCLAITFGDHSSSMCDFRKGEVQNQSNKIMFDFQ